MKQHKWHKEIKAWADGAEVEFRYSHEGKWSEWEFESVPIWTVGEEYQYRIKSQPKEEDWVMICKKCGDELGIVYEPKDEIGDAEIKQMLNDIEYYQKQVEELEEQCEQLKTTITKFREIEDEYAHRKPLSNNEVKTIKKSDNTQYVKTPTGDIYITVFDNGSCVKLKLHHYTDDEVFITLDKRCLKTLIQALEYYEEW